MEQRRSKNELLEVKAGSKLTFGPRVTQTITSKHNDVLAMPKRKFRGFDFFQKPEFRGLLLPDYQLAIGEKAWDSVDLLNKTAERNFPTLKTYQESFS